jgi:hypothetical protein
LTQRIFNCLATEPAAIMAWLDGADIDSTWIDFLDFHGAQIRPGYAWTPRLPEVVVSDWARNFSRVGLGRIAMSTTGWTSTHRRFAVLMKAEWERIKLDASADPVRKFLVALATVATDPPHERDDLDLLLVVLSTAVQDNLTSLHHVLNLIKAAHQASDYAFLVDLLDRTQSTLDVDETRYAYEFLVSYQSSEWTEISFEAMRPL